MANEIMDLNRVKVDYTPAKLEIENYEKLSKMVEEYTERFNNLVFNEDDRAGLTLARSDLLALQNALDDQRKQVKREYNKPLDVFEGKFRYLYDLINEPLSEARQLIQKLDDAERDKRVEALDDYLNKQIDRVNGLGDVTIAMDDIERDKKWLNKGNWTDKLEPRQSLKDDVLPVIEKLVEDKKQYAMDAQIVSEFCVAMQVEPGGWLAQLDSRRPTEIIKDITEMVSAKAQMEKDKPADNATDDAPVDVPIDAPGIVEPDEVPLPGEVKFNKPMISNTIEVTGTYEQLQALNKYLVGSGIKVRQVG